MSKHISIPIEDQDIEFINISPSEFSPLISKCQIKVCYVSDEPNRNKSIITKEVAEKMASSLRGCPIVGYYDSPEEDFDEHNREITLSKGEFKIKDITKPYGFVDLNAKVWFQKFLDDGEEEREYLVTEGYLWTAQYPEAQRIIEDGNNQSMELNQETLNAHWTKDNNGKPKFFIINEAIIEKLCILGENAEPCFEGANITNVQFSLDDDFKQQLSSMMAELKEFLDKGGRAKVFTQYALEIGDKMFRAIYNHLRMSYNKDYYLKAVYQEGEQKFAIISDCCDEKLYRMNFNYSEEGFNAEDLIEVEETYVPKTNISFSLKDIQDFEEKETEFKKNEDKDDKEDKDNSEDSSEESNSSEEESSDEKEEDDEDEDKDKKKAKYCLEEIPEYMELVDRYHSLETRNNELEAELATLKEFKLNIERGQKQDMIDKTFYMLSDEDKKDVIDNIDKYSLDEIEAKLSVICVRNRVNFSTLEENDNTEDPLTYNLNGETFQDNSVPEWVKAVLDTAKNKSLN